MIKSNGNVFILETKNLSYVLHKNEEGLIIHDYFGNHIDLNDYDISPIEQKNSVLKGTEVVYNEGEVPYSMNSVMTEYSFPHKGDLKTTPILLRNEKYGYVFDFKFEAFDINNEIKEVEGLPTPHKGDNELVIYLSDKLANIALELHYVVFEESDVIARNVVIKNRGTEDLHILKALSFQLDLMNNNYQLINFTGGWASEMNEQVQDLKVGMYVHESRSGNSSAKANPFFILKSKDASLNHGDVYSFNLIYSGNHLSEVELTSYGLVRAQAGINSFCFDWKLEKSGVFATPFAVMTYSSFGLNGVRRNMHHFVNNHVVPENWNNHLRPVAINNWEATYFRFKEKKLVKIAKKGKTMGAELFVLDDGWFGDRNNDTAGLGDYDVNKKKLPHGLNGLAKRINKLGMKFGLWFEPESVNPNSELYNEHPEWAIHCEDRNPSLGRNQLLLNLTLKEVRDYIIENVSNVLKSANIEYVKWDMNRNMSDIPAFMCGEFYHRYILGLYEIMKELIHRFPNILFEGCASGGNRFDLGILSFFPQIWASDDTDAIERLRIQNGYLYGYPQSCLSNHISSVPSHQPLRKTPIDTRFNVAMFGVLGYELLPNEMPKKELKRVKELIEIYKDNREIFQFGEALVLSDEDSQLKQWQVSNKEKTKAFLGHFNVLQSTLPKDDFLLTSGLIDNELYNVNNVRDELDLLKFGGLINFMLPFHLNPNGKLARFLSNRVHIKSEKDSYEVYGNVLNNRGLLLNPQWSASGFNDGVRVLGDFGSRLYVIEAKNVNETH